MSRPIISAVLTVAGMMAIATSSAFSAELSPAPSDYVRHERLAQICDPCGCIHVSYVYHRELRATYGTGFDPRVFDQTQPRFYLGPVRGYPRFYLCRDPAK